MFGDIESGEAVEQCRGFVLDLLATPNETWSSQTQGANSIALVSMQSSFHFDCRRERDEGVDLVADLAWKSEKWRMKLVSSRTG